MGHNKLTEKQERFAQAIANKEYKYHWEAYSAVYDANKSSQNTLYVNSCKLLSNTKVTLRIAEIEAKIKEAEKITLDEIVLKLSDRIKMDPREMFNDDDTLKAIRDMTQLQATFINSFEVHTIFKGDDDNPMKVEIKKVKLESIQAIMDMVVKIYGGYIKDKEVPQSNLDAIKEMLESAGVSINK